MAFMIWYAFCFASGNKLGKLYLFSISQGSFDEKIWLIFAELALIVITLTIRIVEIKKMSQSIREPMYLRGGAADVM